MRYISDLQEGDRISSVYLCKQKTGALTRNGKPYDNVLLQDKSGTIDGKIWDPNSQGIADFEAMDFIEVTGDVTSFSGTLQMNIRRVRIARPDEYRPEDYMPSSQRSSGEMLQELLAYVGSVKNPHLAALLKRFFTEDKEFFKSFTERSAAKTVHHAFVGGLMEHTLSVTRFCEYLSSAYPLIRRDLLVTAALLHDIGKTQELNPFPLNDYSEEGQLIGHIVIGAQMIHDQVRSLPGFPHVLENELVHCILAHHGELEYGSPKKPALMEALALHLADNADARLQTMTELFDADKANKTWIGFNRQFDSNLRRTEEV